jgi:methionine synthase II (cobalamin-independent)
VFREVGTACGQRLKRVPDGEPGGRRLWISWQWPLLRALPYFELGDPNPDLGLSSLKLAPGVDPAEIEFGELGYAREARTSYQDFLAARKRGDLPEATRFQVSLPTPFAVISAFIDQASAPAVMPAYERAMFSEVDQLCASIPLHDLAIQWDVCIEMVLWDGRTALLPQFPGYKEVVKATLASCCAAVPADVEMGVHLCYGDLDAQHFVEPADLGKAIELATLIREVSPRPITWLHMPVPIDRDDDAYFAPLSGLELEGTELYLGLIHHDGTEANNRRVAAASKHASDFGVATECGIARQRSPDRVRDLIQAHAAATTDPR